MKNIFFILIFTALFYSCKPKESPTANKPVHSIDFITPNSFGLVNFNLSSIDETKGIKQFIQEKLEKNKEFKILNELKFSFDQYTQVLACINSHELFIITLKNSCDLSEKFNAFLKHKAPKYTGERLLFEETNVYRVSRKEEVRFCAQVSPNIILIGQQQDLLAALSIKATAPHPLIKKVDFSIPLSLHIQQSDLLPPQLKDIKLLSGSASYRDELHLKLEGEFTSSQATKNTENMLRTLLGFTQLPNEMRKSLDFKPTDSSLTITAKVKDEEVIQLLKEAATKDD